MGHKPQRRRSHRQYETTGTVVLRRARVSQMPTPGHVFLRRLRNGSIVLLVAAAILALWVLLDDRFYIYGVDVVGAVRVSPTEIFQASDLAGYHVLWAHPAEAETLILAALPSLEAAQVACGLPARCTITVVERQPRMMWDEDGQLWWVDADGVLFPAQGMLSEGWVIRGPLPRDERGLIEEQVRIGLAELWATGADISPLLTYVEGRGLLITDARGWRVIVGRGSGMQRRLDILEALAVDLQTRGLTPRLLDLSYLDAPYYSLTNDW